MSDTETLSSAEVSLCCGEAGEKEKERARGTTVREKREERHIFPSSHRPPCAFYFFDYCYFYRDIQGEPLRRRKVLMRYRALGCWALDGSDHQLGSLPLM